MPDTPTAQVLVIPQASVDACVAAIAELGVIPVTVEGIDVTGKVAVLRSNVVDPLDYAPLADMILAAGAYGIVILGPDETLSAEDAETLIEGVRNATHD